MYCVQEPNFTPGTGIIMYGKQLTEELKCKIKIHSDSILGSHRQEMHVLQEKELVRFCEVSALAQQWAGSEKLKNSAKETAEH